MRRLLIARYCTLFETKPVLNSFIDHVSKRTVEVRWSDGKYGHFPYVWLRDTSPDSHTHTFSPAMKARNITMRHFDKFNLSVLRLSKASSLLIGLMGYLATSFPYIFQKNFKTYHLFVHHITRKYGHFPYVWLRDTSPDSHTHTFSPAMKARNITMRHFDVEVQPQRVALEQGELVINWPDGILSKFSSEWLRIRNPSDEEVRRRRRHVYFEDTRMWNAREIDSRLGRYKFKDVINDDLVLHDFLWSVCLDGIAIVSEGPPDAVDQIGRRIGLIHRTHFGEIFEVSTKTDASNMAYASNKEVPFHTDFTSLSDPPQFGQTDAVFQLQMLHMIQRADEGGLNLFVDGFYVAEQVCCPAC
uniref:TauD domain-containing protein n=1 Tax=Toxocara canis TaxID=6265 RepID=A0A183V842_TOXCA